MPRKAAGPTGRFGRVLKELRTQRHISQAVLAKAAGVSPGYIGLIEVGQRGENPNIDIVKRLAQALGATVEQTERLLRAGGHLGERETLIRDHSRSFESLVSDQELLTQEQKDLMLGMYATWVSQPRVPESEVEEAGEPEPDDDAILFVLEDKGSPPQSAVEGAEQPDASIKFIMVPTKAQAIEIIQAAATLDLGVRMTNKWVPHSTEGWQQQWKFELFPEPDYVPDIA